MLTWVLMEQPVFPTHVGVFSQKAGALLPAFCLPHTCGGVFVSFFGLLGHAESSPHMWGCFLNGVIFDCSGAVFPTHVGVFCGGGPRLVDPSVFPTHVGVFPEWDSKHWSALSLPHTCGGVSMTASPSGPESSSSPHAWGVQQSPLPHGRGLPLFCSRQLTSGRSAS